MTGGKVSVQIDGLLYSATWGINLSNQRIHQKSAQFRVVEFVGGERRVEQVGVGFVAGADQRDFFRDADLALLQAAQNTLGQFVIGGEDSPGRVCKDLFNQTFDRLCFADEAKPG